MIVRRATNLDVDGVVRVIHAVFDEYGFTWEEDGYHADLYDLEASYDAIGDRFYVAELDGAILGTAALEIFPPNPGAAGAIVQVETYRRVSGTDCSVERLYVHPDGRRRGVGQALLAHVIGEARALGFGNMEIWSDKRFTDAHRLYQRFGAVVAGDRILDDPDESPEWGLYIPL